MTKTTEVECALGYVRVSVQPQGTSGAGIDDQEICLRDHYERVGIRLADIYRDCGASGTGNSRLGFQALIDHALQPGSGIAEIAVHTLSRLFRDRDLLDRYRQKLNGAGIRIVAVTDFAGPQESSGHLSGRRREP